MERKLPFLTIALCVAFIISIALNIYLISKLDEKNQYGEKIMKDYEEYINNNTPDTTLLYRDLKEWYRHRY